MIHAYQTLVLDFGNGVVAIDFAYHMVLAICHFSPALEFVSTVLGSLVFVFAADV
jgi:hypothetical protein